MKNDEFARLAEPYRRELLAHCYRMMGSIHDAEDVVQETYLRAWRGYSAFEGRSSVRVWLYRIATNACLSALDHRNRRVLPAGIGASSTDAAAPLELAGPDVAWVAPMPDSDPATIVADRGSVRLAFVVALQKLPARQRAALIMRDVLSWRAAEVAELLEMSTEAVNSALARARAQLGRTAAREDETAEPPSAADRVMLDRYASAFENADVDGLISALRHDVALEMPPHLTWFLGRDVVGRFLTDRVLAELGPMRTAWTRANGQPALAMYLPDRNGSYEAHAIQVLTASADGIERIVSFNEPGLFSRFGLPMSVGPTRSGD